jgi:hypothetical protein
MQLSLSPNPLTTHTILKLKTNKDSSTSASPPLRMTPLRQKLVILSAAKDLPISI